MFTKAFNEIYFAHTHFKNDHLIISETPINSISISSNYFLQKVVFVMKVKFIQQQLVMQNYA